MRVQNSNRRNQNNLTGVFFLVFLVFQSSNFLVQGLSQIPDDCVASNQYYNSLLLQCKNCNSEESFSKLNQFECGCELGTEPQNTYDIGFVKDDLKCVDCVDCECENQFREFLEYGQDLGAEPNCYQCSEFAIESSGTDYCEVCPHHAMRNEENECICQTVKFTVGGEDYEREYVNVGDFCVQTEFMDEINGLVSTTQTSVYYYSLPGRKSNAPLIIQSNLVEDNWEYNVAACFKYSNPKGCQVVANICTMNLYNEKNKICQLSKQFEESNDSMPDIHLSRVSKPEKLSGLDFEVTFNKDVEQLWDTIHELRYWLMEFDFEGNMLEFRELEDEFQLCPHTVEDVAQSKRFGVDFENSCTLNMEAYVSNYKSTFFELYIQHGETNWLGVPVLVKNYRLDNGDEPNRDTEADANDKYYFKRFMIIDNISSVDDNTGIPKVLRFASSIRIVIRMLSNIRMYVPTIEIEYKERYVENKVLEDPSVSISYKTEYVNEMPGFWLFANIFFFLFLVVILAVLYVRVKIWYIYNPKDLETAHEGNYYVQVLTNVFGLACDTFSQGYFYFLLIMTGYWFIGFKFQSDPYLLIPPYEETFTENYLPFNILFAIMSCFSFVAAIFLIYKQTSIDIFFIDWEKPVIFKEEEDAKRGISVWRTLFVANELNELSVVRTLSIEWNLMILGFFLAGWEWEDWALETPTLDTGILHIEHNYILKYFVSTAVYLCIGLSQLILRFLVETWFPLKIKEFVDLCSVANISLFVLDQDLHGYYLHGKAPNQVAEGNALWIQRALLDEGKTLKSRGLGVGSTPEQQKCQVYEMIVPRKLRIKYEEQYITTTDQDDNKKKDKKGVKKNNQNNNNDKKTNFQKRDSKQGFISKRDEENREDGDSYDNESNEDEQGGKLKIETDEDIIEDEKKQQKKNKQVKGALSQKDQEQEIKKRNLTSYLQAKVRKSCDRSNEAIFEMPTFHRFIGLPDMDKRPDSLDLRQKDQKKLTNKDFNKTLNHTVDNVQPERETESNNYWPIFFYDNRYSIQGLFFLGKEMQLLIFNIYIFNAFDMIFSSTLVAIVLTYVIDKTLTWRRESRGQDNLSEKTLISEKFLI